LQRQIALVRPRVILAVGAVAAQTLLNSHDKLGSLRGRCHAYGESAIPLVVTYHPAYLLRTPSKKRQAWQDLQLARQVAAVSGT
jgi:DNA polymerase